MEKDPKGLASALKNILKQDAVQGIAQKKRKALEDEKAEKSAGANPVVNEEHSDDDDSEDEANGTTSNDNADNPLAIDLSELCVGGINDDPFEPTEEDMEAARTILKIDEREGAADRIYILDGYPANKAEGDAMIGAGLDGVLDAVIKVYAEDPGARVRVRGFEPPPSEGTLSRNSSRASMQSIQASTQAFAEETQQDNVIDALKQAAATAEGPSWGDVAFLEILVKAGNPLMDLPTIGEEVAEEYSAPEFIGDFMKIVGDVAFEKYRFRKYLSLCDHVVIPNDQWGKFANEDDTAFYNQLLDSVPGVCYTVPVLLDCVVATVVRAHEHDLDATPDPQCPERNAKPLAACSTRPQPPSHRCKVSRQKKPRQAARSRK